MFTVPLLGGGQLCYEIHGEPGLFLNLVSDKCTSVNAEYTAINIPNNGNIISAIGIKVVGLYEGCYNIEVRLTSNGSIETFVDENKVFGMIDFDGIQVMKISNLVRISVPNCDLVDLVMWVIPMSVDGQNRLKFVISRGCNLAPTSHGLLGNNYVYSMQSILM